MNTQLGGMKIKEHDGNGEQEKPYMDIGGRETQDMGHRSDNLKIYKG